ncbi:hypothetical protein NiCM35_17495 [Niallia circulans]|uniref:hypothetical protein n=1 Tax=Niallia circulans TaxID=1397 RepID=UPI003D962BF6
MFIRQMKTEKEGGRGKSSVHKTDKKPKKKEVEGKVVFIRRMKTEKKEVEGKVVFIRQMKTEKEGGRGKSGVHKADENRKRRR